MGGSNSKPSDKDSKDAVKEKLKTHKTQQQQKVANEQRTQHDTEKKMLNKATREAQLEGEGANPLNVSSVAQNKAMAEKLKETNEEAAAKAVLDKAPVEPLEIGDDPDKLREEEEKKRKKMEKDTIDAMGGGRRRKRTRRRKKKSKKKKKKSKKRRKRKRKRTKKKRRRRKSRK